MARVYLYPGPPARSVIHTSVQLYGAGYLTREQMASVVVRTLHNFRVRRMAIGDYYARVKKSVGGSTAVAFDTRTTAHTKQCPICGTLSSSALPANNVVMVCGTCGCVFKIINKNKE